MSDEKKSLLAEQLRQQKETIEEDEQKHTNAIVSSVASLRAKVEASKEAEQQTSLADKLKQQPDEEAPQKQTLADKLKQQPDEEAPQKQTLADKIRAAKKEED